MQVIPDFIVYPGKTLPGFPGLAAEVRPCVLYYPALRQAALRSHGNESDSGPIIGNLSTSSKSRASRSFHHITPGRLICAVFSRHGQKPFFPCPPRLSALCNRVLLLKPRILSDFFAIVQAHSLHKGPSFSRTFSLSFFRPASCPPEAPSRQFRVLRFASITGRVLLPGFVAFR